MEFRTGNITVNFTAKEFEIIRKAREVVCEFYDNMKDVNKNTALWNDDCGGAGFMSIEDIYNLQLTLERFTDIDEVY